MFFSLNSHHSLVSSMPEFTCRLGTPAGELITKVVEADGAEELKLRLEREGFRVFAIDLPGANLGGIFSFSTQGECQTRRIFPLQSTIRHFVASRVADVAGTGRAGSTLKAGDVSHCFGRCRTPHSEWGFAV